MTTDEHAEIEALISALQDNAATPEEVVRVERHAHLALGGDRNDLRLGYVGGGAAPDGKLHAGAGVRIMAVDNDLHRSGWYRHGGSADARLRVVVIMTPWPPHP